MDAAEIQGGGPSVWHQRLALLMGGEEMKSCLQSFSQPCFPGPVGGAMQKELCPSREVCKMKWGKSNG